MCFEIPKGRRKKGLSAAGVKIMACKLATNHSVAGRPVHSKCPKYGHQERRSLRGASRRLRRCVLRSTTTFSTYAWVGQILDDYARKMRDAENDSHEGKRKTESLWPIMRISHTRSRYIYELYYKRDAISKELYNWLLKENYADAK